MISFHDHTLVLFPPRTLIRAYRSKDVLAPITEYIDYSKSGILLDNTTLFTAYEVLVQETSEPVLPHYLLDIGVLATAVSFFDRVYFLNAGARREWHDFFIEYVRDRDEHVFIEIPAQPREINDPLHLHFRDIFSEIGIFFRETPGAAQGYQNAWETILGETPNPPDLHTVRRLLDTPKHPLQDYADQAIEHGYIDRNMDGKLIKALGALDEYCVLSSSKALFYSALARELGIPYLPNSLRGASLLAFPIISADENLKSLNMNLDLLQRIKRQVSHEIEYLELIREFTRIPLALSALFNYKRENPTETLLDCLLWLRRHTTGYRSSIDKYLAVLKGEDCGIIEAERASKVLQEDFSGFSKYTRREGLILKLAGTVLKASDKSNLISILFDMLSQIASSEDFERFLLRFHRPYLHTALSLKEAAKECLDLSPVYYQVFGKPYPDRFLKMFERITKFHPTAGF